jgi:hypothetical protein
MPPSWTREWTGDEDATELLAVLVLVKALDATGLELVMSWLRAALARGGLEDLVALLVLDMAGKELARIRGRDPGEGSVVPDDARELDRRREW